MLHIPTDDKGNATASVQEQAQVIRRSWERCEALGLRASRSAKNAPCPATTLREEQQRNAALLRLAAPELNMLQQATADVSGIVLLTDDRGLILDARGDASFLDRAGQVALLPGAEWSEGRAGTNAVGTAIAEAKLIEVFADQHFLEENHFLVCTAMPVLDPLGQLSGIVDISGDARRAHPHARALLQLAVTNLEHRWTQDLAKPGDHIIHLHPHPAYLNTPQEGLVIVRDGLLLGANRAARVMLALDDRADHGAGVPWMHLFQAPLQEGQYSLSPQDGGAPLHMGVTRVSKPPSHPPLRATSLAPSSIQVEGTTVWDGSTLPLRKKAARALQADIPILLHGETGSGKELFVRAIHADSSRSRGPMVAVNCAALPESLFEAELFGYAAGAFTGARREGSTGRLREADGGVLFLDEIGDMPLSLQGRLLRVLQDRVVQPLGGGRSTRVDFVLVAATHKPLDQEVAAGRFRADLYYRLRHLTLTLPPLRARADLPAIIDALVEAMGASERGIRLSPRLRRRLLEHPWPGNFRELANLLRTLIALSDDDQELCCDDLPNELEGAPPATVCRPLQETEAEQIERTLAACGGNVSEAARRLGIHRSTLHRKLNRH